MCITHAINNKCNWELIMYNDSFFILILQIFGCMTPVLEVHHMSHCSREHWSRSHKVVVHKCKRPVLSTKIVMKTRKREDPWRWHDWEVNHLKNHEFLSPTYLIIVEFLQHQICSRGVCCFTQHKRIHLLGTQLVHNEIDPTFKVLNSAHKVIFDFGQTTDVRLQSQISKGIHRHQSGTQE